jgi:hypothetical protein
VDTLEHVDTGLETVTVEFPDEHIKCTSRRGCSRDAVWWIDCPGCGVTDFACTPCRDRNDAALAQQRMRRPNGITRCSECDTELPYPLEWKPL